MIRNQRLSRGPITEHSPLSNQPVTEQLI